MNSGIDTTYTKRSGDMKVLPSRTRIVIQSDADEGRLVVCYDNRGEPYREGIDLSLERGPDSVGVFIETWEVRALRDLLNRLHPVGVSVDLDVSALESIADALAADASNPNAEQQAQLVRDVSKLVGQADAFRQQAEELALWKARALEAEGDLKELPTQDMILLQADNYAKASNEEAAANARADLHTMILQLNTDN